MFAYSNTDLRPNVTVREERIVILGNIAVWIDDLSWAGTYSSDRPLSLCFCRSLPSEDSRDRGSPLNYSSKALWVVQKPERTELGHVKWDDVVVLRQQQSLSRWMLLTSRDFHFIDFVNEQV